MLNRRGFLGASASMASLAAVAPVFAQPAVIAASTELMPKSSQPRIVIVGGGWGGFSAARHLREQAPNAEVVVLERNPVFWSCPISNKWLIDVVNTDYLRSSGASKDVSSATACVPPGRLQSLRNPELFRFQ